MFEDTIFDVLIIGAGAAGIFAANRLKDEKLNVLLLDKGKVPGGRIASRKLSVNGGNVFFDYGVQSFSIKRTPVKDILSRAKLDRALHLWPLDKNINNVFVNGGNKLIPETLAKGLNIHNSIKVVKIDFYRNWEIETEHNGKLFAKKIICTLPAPQALDLAKAGNAKIDKDSLFKLTSVDYKSNIVLLIRMKKKCNITSFVPDSPKYDLVINNLDKGYSQSEESYTIQFGSNYSVHNAGKSSIEYLWEFLDDLKLFTREHVADFAVHRWKFSKPVVHLERNVFLKCENNLYFTGDYFGSNTYSHLENAMYSGLEAANDIINRN